MTTWLIVAGIWLILALPLAVLIGKSFKRADKKNTRPVRKVNAR